MTRVRITAENRLAREPVDRLENEGGYCISCVPLHPLSLVCGVKIKVGIFVLYRSDAHP